ncbi:MAG: NADH-quinone oxidoreductase subunit NuoE [candidate division KSB1 bacterium]|jgi:NADH-quinone oxidoreductase subunit E|nr:NADH-quinone oxidoreductase subunit NuoE [candidate division KSB1 bacterium]
MSTSTLPQNKDAVTYTLDAKLVSNIEKLADQFPDKHSAILPALHIIQDEFNWIPPESVNQLCDILDTTPNKIYSVLTFYTMFHTKPVGKYHIQVCRNVSCSLMGASNLIEHLTQKLNIQPGETTPDGKFTLSLVECLGACGNAPVMMLNDRYHENLTADKIDDILKSLE